MLRNSSKADDDRTIVASVQQGNQQSFVLLYDKYAAALLGIISRIVNDQKPAEEILNTSFVKAWNQIGMFNPDNSSIFTWLINLARQTAFDEMKAKEVKNPPHNNPVYGEAKNVSPGTVPSQASVFDLVYFKGLTLSETAAELHIPIDEVKADLKMTIQRMKEKETIC